MWKNLFLKLYRIIEKNVGENFFECEKDMNKLIYNCGERECLRKIVYNVFMFGLRNKDFNLQDWKDFFRYLLDFAQQCEQNKKQNLQNSILVGEKINNIYNCKEVSYILYYIIQESRNNL